MRVYFPLETLETIYPFRNVLHSIEKSFLHEMLSVLTEIALFYCFPFSRIRITFSRLWMDHSLSHSILIAFAIEYKISTRHWDKDAIWNIRRKYCENLMNTLSKIQSHSSLRQRRVHFPRVLVKRKIYRVKTISYTYTHMKKSVALTNSQEEATNERANEWKRIREKQRAGAWCRLDNLPLRYFLSLFWTDWAYSHGKKSPPSVE